MLTNEKLAAQFTWIDYVIFAIMLVISAAIGLYYSFGGNKQKTAKDVLIANRSMSVFPVTLSLLASFISAPGVLGVPAEIYLYGTSYFLMIISLVIAIPVSAYVYLPIFYDLGVTSSYEYLEKRFNKHMRKLASIIFIINMVLFLSIVTYVPALALSQVTGIHVWTSVSAIGIVCVIYTSVGGIKGVMWTDVFQILVMFGAMFLILIRGLIKVGGFKAVWDIAHSGNRLNPFNFSINPLERHTFYGLTIGASFMWISVYGVNQTQVQRYLTSPTKSKAQIALWLNLPGQLLFISCSVLTGLVLYSYYWSCDPLKEERVASAIQLLPLFVMEIMSDFPGLPGVFVAGLFSSSLSTLSSGLNALAAVTFEDFVLGIYTPKTEEIGGWITKILALGFGVISVGLIVVVQQIDNIFQAVLTLFGAVGAPMLGVFTLGMMFPCANSVGAVTGFISGNALTLWITIGAFIVKPVVHHLPLTTAGCNFSNVSLTWIMQTESTSGDSLVESFIDFYKISYLWYSAIGVFTVVVVGLFISLLTGGNKSKSLDPQLLFYPIRKFYIILWRKQLRKRYYMGKDQVYTIKNYQIEGMKFESGIDCVPATTRVRRDSAFY